MQENNLFQYIKIEVFPEK